MENAQSVAHSIWRGFLRIVMDNANHPDSANVIPQKFEPDIKKLHSQLAGCPCAHSACTECVESRRVLLWVWEKMDAGF